MMPDWQTIFGDLSAAAVAVWLVAIIGLVIAGFKAWPVVRKFVRTIDALGELPDFIAGTKEHRKHVADSLAELRHEVLPNNGSSLRDVADRTERRVHQLADWQTKHEKKSDAALARIDALERGNERKNNG